MKILIDARFYGNENTGLGRYTTNFVRALANLDSSDEYHLLLNSKYIKSLSLPNNFHKVACDIPHYTIREQLILPTIINRIDPDIYHALHLNVPIFINVPYIVTIHDLIKSHFTSKETSTKSGPIFYLKRIGYNLVINTVIKNSKSIICPSNFVKKDILSLYKVKPSKIHPIYEAPDPFFDKKYNKAYDKLLPKLKVKKPYILYVGNAYPHKNIKTLIQAFEGLSDKSLSLVIVSKNNQFLQKIYKDVSSKTLSRIRSLENLSDKEMLTLYKNAKVTVIPSLMEGFGLVGLESLSLKTPIVVSNIDVFKEVYGDSAIYADSSLPGSFTKAINKALKTRRSGKLPRSYSWDNLAENISNIYHENSTSIRPSK